MECTILIQFVKAINSILDSISCYFLITSTTYIVPFYFVLHVLFCVLDENTNIFTSVQLSFIAFFLLPGLTLRNLTSRSGVVYGQ